MATTIRNPSKGSALSNGFRVKLGTTRWLRVKSPSSDH
jgi:hypothetical protein